MKKLSIVALSTIMATNVYAKCDAWNVQQVFDDIKRNHPVIEVANKQNKVLRKNIDKVDVLPNPSLSLSTMSGDEKDTMMGTLTQKILIGGKRSSSVDVATKRWELGKVELEKLKERKLIESILVLHHFSHIDEESKLYKEALSSFKSIMKRWKKRKLSPSEQIEKETLSIVYSSYLLRLSELESEKVELAKHLAFFGNNDNCLDPANYTGEFNLDYRPMKKGTSLDVLEAKKILELSRSELSYEKSLAYPDIKIGPRVEIEKTPVATQKSIGLGVSFDLPFFNRNSGGKAMALQKIEAASTSLKYKKREDDFDKRIWRDKYERHKNALSKMISEKQLQKRHDKVERLFKRGIISASLSVEVHKQLIEFHEKKYEFERETLRSLWNIYRLEGTFQKRTL